MKNIIMTAILAISLILVGGRAYAEDVYVGKFSATKDVYLITESLSGTDTDNFRCTVKVVDRVSELLWKYEFFTINGEHHYTLIMNTGFIHTSSVYDGQPYSQPAVKILRHVKNNY